MPSLSSKQLEQALANLATIAQERREATHCSEGHELSGDNVRYRKDGRRHCKTCQRAMQKRWYFLSRARLEGTPNDPRHGRTLAVFNKCRCYRCRIAKSNYRRERGSIRVSA